MDPARRTLCDIVESYGARIADEPRRLENLLNDLCGDERRAIFLLVHAARERVPAELAQALERGGAGVQVRRSTQRLCDDLGLGGEAARWAVETWALALGARHGGAAVVTVSQQGSGQFSSLAEALRRAPPGARIEVGPGTYAEALLIDRPVEIVAAWLSQDDQHAPVPARVAGAPDAFGPAGPGQPATPLPWSDRRVPPAGQEVVVEALAASCVRMQTDYAVVRGLTLRGQAGLGTRSLFAVDVPRGELVLEECDISSRSLACVAIHGRTANPVLRRCRIHDAQGSGVFVHERGSGTLEDCLVEANALAGVEIGKQGSPVLRRCRITGGRQAGVYVSLGGAGTFEGCAIVANAGAGVEVGWQGTPVLRGCQVRDNGAYGIQIHAGGGATVEECDLTGNALGAWHVEEG
jgi:hypothetical protein